MDHGETIAAQQRFFNSDGSKGIAFRKAQLKKLKVLLRKNSTLLYDAIYADFRKSAFETDTTELCLVYHEIDLAIRKLSQWSAWKRVPTGIVNFPGKSYIIPEPLGVTLVIGAWNYPYQLSLAPMVAAMAAGNTVILKPSEVPANTAAAMAKIINGNFPPDYLHVVQGGVETTTELLKHRFDKIFFTGSTVVGKIIYEAAAKNLTPVTLELGGKSPAIVLNDADISRTAQRLVWAKFLNAGQTCIAPDYVLVDERVKDALLEALKKNIVRYYSESEQNNYVQIISDKHVDRLEALIDREKLYHGGTVDKPKRYIEPTVLHNITFDHPIMQQEIFGPILPVIAFNDLERAVSAIRLRPKPLACYIFSKSSSTVDRLLQTLSFGGGAINDAVMHIANSHLPFGGVGHSGIGSYHGEAGFKTFSHYKSVLRKSFWFEPALKYAPYNDWKLWFIRRMLK